ncbi:MAG: presqualene diphosphate synthase HpnD [Methyloceanibacter sp.]|jgi:presqualene diphosphate synthase|nr:presqualene diphosphate synthase HpnD [Methyloceanibacter sp.]
MSGPDRQNPTQAAVAPVARRSSFYLAMRILPPERREAMYQVYAFCRAVDDIADDDGSRSGRVAMLDRWRTDIARLYAGRGPTELTKGLAAPVQTFGLRQEDFRAIIDGMETDVRRDIRAPEWEALDLYCDRVASAVGRLSVKIFGIEEEKGLLLSHHLGRALQMTNILRDLDQDAKMGRLYLPKEALVKAGITEEDVNKVLAHPLLGQACAAVVTRARRHFAEASMVMAGCNRQSVRSPRIMASVYRALLEGLVNRGWSEPRPDVRTSRFRFLWAVMRYGVV